MQVNHKRGAKLSFASVYWVRCKLTTLFFTDETGRKTIEQRAIKFVVGRGLGLNPTSHGFLGELTLDITGV